MNNLRDLLYPLANELAPAPMCWIGDGDAGPDYCRSCAQKEVDRLRAADPSSTAFVDGGWDESRESDGHAACSTCGRTLQHSLTQYGLSEEVADYRSRPFKKPTDAEVAYSVINILDAAEFSSERNVVRSALRIARAAVRALPGAAA